MVLRSLQYQKKIITLAPSAAIITLAPSALQHKRGYLIGHRAAAGEAISPQLPSIAVALQETRVVEGDGVEGRPRRSHFET